MQECLCNGDTNGYAFRLLTFGGQSLCTQDGTFAVSKHLTVGMMFDVYALEIMLMMNTGGAVAKSTPKGGGAF